MSDTVVYFRGPQSAIGVLPLSDQKFLDDAGAVLGMSDDQVSALESELQTSEGFVAQRELLELVQKVLFNQDLAERVARFIAILDRFFRESQNSLDSFHELFAEQLEDQCKEAFSSEQRGVLTSRTKKLISNQPSLARHWKADRLSSTTGRRLEEFRIICDLRPVFSSDWGAIEGMIPVTTIKVVATDHDGLPACLETIVSERQLNELEEAVAKAQKKLGAMRALLLAKGIAVPTLSGALETTRGGS